MRGRVLDGRLQPQHARAVQGDQALSSAVGMELFRAQQGSFWPVGRTVARDSYEEVAGVGAVGMAA